MRMQRLRPLFIFREQRCSITRIRVIEELRTALCQGPRSIMILAHKNPDGDAIGSVLALSIFLKKLGHRTACVLPTDYPPFFGNLPDSDTLYVYEGQKHAVDIILREVSMFFILDLNNLQRLDDLGHQISEHSAPKVLIDHHLDPDLDAFDILCSDTSASSTCELLFEVLRELDSSLICTDIAKCLYTGILTDTGTFSYNTTPRTFRNVASLVELGRIDHVGMQYEINNNIPEKNIRLLGFCLNNRLEVIPELRAGIVHLTSEDFNRWRIKRGDTEGIVNYILKIAGIDVAGFFTDQRSIIKVSLRSYGDISVADLCSDHFSGGGHKNASGGHYHGTLEEVIASFKRVLPNYLDK